MSPSWWSTCLPWRRCLINVYWFHKRILTGLSKGEDISLVHIKENLHRNNLPGSPQMSGLRVYGSPNWHVLEGRVSAVIGIKTCFDNTMRMAGFQSSKTRGVSWLFALESKISFPCQLSSHQYFIAVLLSWEYQNKNYIGSSFPQRNKGI